MASNVGQRLPDRSFSGKMSTRRRISGAREQNKPNKKKTRPERYPFAGSAPTALHLATVSRCAERVRIVCHMHAKGAHVKMCHCSIISNDGSIGFWQLSSLLLSCCCRWVSEEKMNIFCAVPWKVRTFFD